MVFEPMTECKKGQNTEHCPSRGLAPEEDLYAQPTPGPWQHARVTWHSNADPGLELPACLTVTRGRCMVMKQEVQVTNLDLSDLNGKQTDTDAGWRQGQTKEGAENVCRRWGGGR